MPTPPDLQDAVRAGARRLAAAGVASPRFDAEELAGYALGVPRSGLHGLRLTPAALTALNTAFPALIDRRVAREPLQHITGRAHFRHLTLAVGPGVFVPRPETEVLVDLIGDHAGSGSLHSVVDLCAGSGAIGLALASERPGTVVHLVEADPAALRWLRRNVDALALDPAPQVHEAPVRDALPGLYDADVVVANPPYLPTEGGYLLAPEVADFDPAAALWGGPDGLAVIREVVVAAARLLRPDGMLGLEHDACHQHQVVDLLREAGFAEVTAHVDLTSTPRFVTGFRR